MADQRRGGVAIAGVNGTVGVVLIVLVAVLALVVKPPAPPGIAAFAPQANKPIIKAPLSQSVQSGDGDGACFRGQPCALASTTTTAAKAKARGVPSALQCYSWPDGSVTQSFDPQSPPCIATWDDRNGNGGATSPGVSASEIRVAFPVNDVVGPSWPNLKPIADFFNTRFQFYGRKITVVPFTSQMANQQSTGKGLNDPSMERADATQAAQLKVFASLDFIDPVHYSWSLPVFREVLTRNKIVSVAGGEMVPYGTADQLAAHRPYEWTYYPTIDSLMVNVASMTCRQLVGKSASHSADADFRSKTRKFAVLVPVDEHLGGPLPGLDKLLAILDSCGVRSPRVVRFKIDSGQGLPAAANLQDLKNDGVTSLIFFPYTGTANPATGSPMAAAAQVGYEPEWILIGWNNYFSAIQLDGPKRETQAAFGVAVWNKVQPAELEFWMRSYLAAGGDPAVPNAGAIPDASAFYNEMLLLAAGIQMAGPLLTPETFARGLTTTKFPNPGGGAAPFYQATVGFTPADTAMATDFVGYWLDNRMTGTEVSQQKNINEYRVFCYAGLGRRYSANNWPANDSFYAGSTCR